MSDLGLTYFGMEGEEGKFTPHVMSESSTTTVPDSLWASCDVSIGAGVVIIQPSTGLVVVLSMKETVTDEHGDVHEREIYFLPRGWKNVGESLEETALREGYEEAGYRCFLYPLDIPTHSTAANTPSSDEMNLHLRYPNTEPFYVSLYHTKAGQDKRDMHCPGGRNRVEKITFWYLAQIPEDAVYERGTQMNEEERYETHLVSFEEAIQRFGSSTQPEWTGICIPLIKMAQRIWQATMDAKA